MKKRFLCKIGFHVLFTDSVGENFGTEETPMYFFTTYRACNYCNYRRLRYAA